MPLETVFEKSIWQLELNINQSASLTTFQNSINLVQTSHTKSNIIEKNYGSVFIAHVVARDVRRKSVFIRDVSIIKVKELGWVV